ncbi:DUF960 domain-containing protein [Brevibacillus humidisoli]|uniref:DUF960 family protein n=1 Tax=Brevibacillus humidisoli TaxID=2895522 RepID=UPI001E50DC19|nr:DUF960 family protein [Brevibacillus humidisoli]UFJ40379.1 DUF960 domain-containing protein [Brevibacillus humidisoli]
MSKEIDYMTRNGRFSSDKYVSRGVSERVPLDVQLALWDILEERKRRGDSLDYLQVFELSVVLVNGVPLQNVRNPQEQPPLDEVFCLYVAKPIGGITIWVIDSDKYCTMLFPNEY